jgi:hypothetical protein
MRYPLAFAIALVLVAGCSKYEKQIDAYYYPDRSDLSEWQIRPNVGSIEACRSWAYSIAAQNGDPGISRGDYECGIDPLKDQPYPSSRIIVYRTSTQ